MKKKLLLISLIAPVFLYSQLSQKFLVSSAHGRIGFFQFNPPNFHPDTSYKFPLIIYMHGVGERGNGTSDMWMVLNASFPKLIKQGASLTFDVHGKKHGFIVLMPQMSKEFINWQNFYVEEMIKYAKANLPIDTNKIFLTGWSLGGGGAWKFPTASIDSANLIAGTIPVAPAPNYTNVCNLAKGRVAVWAHQSKDDPSIPIRYTIDAVKGVNACDPEYPARMTYYKIGKHTLVSYIAYDTGNTYTYPNIFQWMIGISRAQRKKDNLAPLPDAGKDTTVILPSLSARLNGSNSYDPNDVITGYLWQMKKGPNSPNLNIAHAHFPTASVTGLEPGEYVFRLTVVDAFGAARFDEVKVNVSLPASGMNATPYVYLGSDKAVWRSSTFLRAEMRDFDGNVTKTEWKQLSGPSAARILTKGNWAQIHALEKDGKYLFEIKAYDNGSPAAVGVDTVMILRRSRFPWFATYWPLDNGRGERFGKPALVAGIVLVIGWLSILIFNWLFGQPLQRKGLI